MMFAETSLSFKLGKDLLAEDSYLGQIPPHLSQHPASRIEGIAIPEPFGRFGNNFYQVINSIAIARYIGCVRLNIQQFNGPEAAVWKHKDFEIEVNKRKAPLNDENWLSGSFFAPFGFEAMFDEISSDDYQSILAIALNTIYKPLVESAITRTETTLIAHFRGGDIFNTEGPIHSWYVQPPAEYYNLAIDHALSKGHFDFVRLVFEDLSNPAIPIVQRHLQRSGVHCFVEKSSLIDDITNMMSAHTLISSPSTLPEACMILSPNIKSYYSFRSHSSQIDYSPFAQSRVRDIIKNRRIAGVIIDDASMSYIQQKQWNASESQLQMIREFPRSCLRLYRTGLV